MGISDVAFFAARTDCGALATIRSGFDWTSSAASCGKLLKYPNGAALRIAPLLGPPSRTTSGRGLSALQAGGGGRGLEIGLSGPSQAHRHRQFSLLHAAAKARVMGNIEVAHLALRQSKEARTHQWIDRLSQTD